MDDVNDASATAEAQPETLIINLAKPITMGPKDNPLTFSELPLREPTAAEWMQWDKLRGVEADVKAIAIVSGVPEGAIRQLGVRDLQRAAKFLAGFFGDAPATADAS